ncbi:MAG: hypothetical protein PHH54_03375 [Candidatus Nanoarchaeia archaeon]|nr:hypothetical protein [Candidatus Nanoarchaeia archaeon]MDD5740998.1 hypothetical protein [Candidatus Nanoarchaeia archaeon]
MEKENKNEANSNKSYNLNNINHTNVGEVHYGDKIHQEIHDNSVNYEVDFPEINNIETLSIYLTSHFKERNIGIVGGISLIASLVSIFTFLNSFMNDIQIINWLPKFSQNTGHIFLIVGVILFVLGSTLLNSLRYKQHAKCKSCGKEYAYKPYKDSNVKDVETKEGTRRTIIDYYKCKYCGNEIERKRHDFIPNEEMSVEDN